MIYFHTDLGTYSVFHENHARWNCVQPFYTSVIKLFKIILSFFLKLFGEKRVVNSVKCFPATIKSINPIQKYPHITESYSCILKIFVVIDEEQSINALISFGICSKPKESK